MGIEPTGAAVIAAPDDFEDRGRHQASRHFQTVLTTTLYDPSCFQCPRPALGPFHARAGFDPQFVVAQQAADHIPAIGAADFNVPAR